MNMTKEKAKEILNKYEKGEKDLFNWCEEYKEYIRDSFSGCVTAEVEFMLQEDLKGNKKSPLSYDDIDFFDEDKATDNLIDLWDNESERENLKEFIEDPEGYNRKIENIEDFKNFLNDLNLKELSEVDLND